MRVERRNAVELVWSNDSSVVVHQTNKLRTRVAKRFAECLQRFLPRLKINKENTYKEVPRNAISNKTDYREVAQGVWSRGMFISAPLSRR